MKKTMINVLSALLLALSGVASAGVVYNNGGPDQVAGNEMTEWIQAEDFTLPGDTLITDVHFWSIENEQVGGFNGSIEYAIYADNGGVPGTILAGFTAGSNLTRTATGNSSFGLAEFAYSFDIAPFSATGGATYWLGLHNGPLTNDARAEVYWETTAGNATATGQEDETPFGDNVWGGNGQEHAFNLTCDNEQICGGGTVPEPATIALVGLALAGLGVSRRRRLR